MGILIQGGRIVDAATDTDKKGDIYLEDGVITEIGEKLKIKDKSDKVIDAKGCLVMPGLIDLHVHFRDPGQTQKEDIETGSRAAARGGVTTVVAMPNTTPVIDSPDRVNYVYNKAKQLAGIHVLQAGAITQGEKGQELSDIEGMVKAGIPALSEDGKSVMNTRLCKEAMEVAEKFNVPIFAHCEDIDLRGDGCMNEDENARRLGLPGICNAVEDVIAARDILLARETGARLHLCHCSTEGVAKMMEIVKEEGLDNITAEVCPHHFILTSDDIKCDDPNYKMNPPLRTKKDVDALIRGLKDGSFKVISTDHAPHAVPEKTGSIRNAAFGIVGIETSFALSYTALVETGILTISQLIEKMSWNPAQILGSDRGTLQKGHPADIVIADIDHEYKIDKNELEEGYMNNAQKQSIIDLYNIANTMNVTNNDQRMQQLIYNIALVKNQKNLVLILFGNGYMANFRELVLEMEIPAFLFNFGLCGFTLYFVPFLTIFIYGLYFGIKNIAKIDDEFIMYEVGSGFTFALSFFSGYTFFNSSTMMIIVVINALLINKIYKIKKEN